MKYDVIIIGAGPGGIFSAYELIHQNKDLKIAVFEEGYSLEKRHCPIDGKKVPSCIKCPTCAIMSGFGGAGAFSDGKYNITNDFGGTLFEYIGKEEALDLMWYLWCGARSPVFGKSKMTTFEHYFVEDKATHKEVMNPYYKLCEKVEICDKILEEFGLKTEGSHIINGHVPVKLKDGEKPVKAGGKLFVIDGGLSKAYQSTTGIAGYTLIYNSHHLALAEHMPFDPKKDSTPKVSVVEKLKVRIMVADTDKGRELKEQIADLKELVAAYREGVIKERAE